MNEPDWTEPTVPWDRTGAYWEACEERDMALAVIKRVWALVAPQWRRTEGEDYSKGRNDMIDAVRAALDG